MNCPGSVRLAALAPPSPTSVHAEEGTAAHTLAERCLRSGADAAEHLQEEIGGFVVDREMAEAVQVYLDAVRSKVAELELIDDHVSLDIERRLNLSWLRKNMFGTADAVISTDREVWVYDYKHGRGVAVGAEENAQLRYYGLGSIGPKPVQKTVHLVVVQPRCYGERSLHEKLTTKELTDWGRDVLAPAADATQKPDAPLVPGEAQCRWCPAKSTCPALHGFALEEAKADFAMVEANEPLPDEAPSPARLRSAELAKVLRAAPLVEQWLAAVRDEAMARALAGKKLPGFKLVTGKTNRRWKDEKQAAKMLRKAGVEPFVSDVLTVPQAEKALGKMKPPIKAAFDKCVEKPPGKPVLANEDDQREEWVSAEKEFADAI